MMLEIGVDLAQLQKVAKLVGGTGKGLRNQLRIAVSKTAKHVKSQMAKEITKKLNVKQKTIKRILVTDGKATTASPSVTIRLKATKKFNLRVFGARQVKKGVSVKVFKDGERETVLGAFKVGKFGGKVYERKGKARGPLDNKRGSSPYHVFIEQSLTEKTQRDARKYLRGQVQERIRFLTLKQSGAI